MDSREVKDLLRGSGAVAAGVAEACPVDEAEMRAYALWIQEGNAAGMGYLAKYDDVRSDPRLLLDGARSVIVAAFSYYYPEAVTGRLRWARYALGRDYHEEVRERLTDVASSITAATGAACRVAVDTAPLRERYWALRAGVGFRGRNGLVIVPGAGSWVVLGEIITTLELQPDAAIGSMEGCEGCGRCVKACPGRALDGSGRLDARRCRSYLTVEHRGDEGMPAIAGGRVYGCDICQEVCPHNRGAAVSAIGAFAPRPEILALSQGDILAMEQGEFSRIFSHSAIKRAKLAGLQRNARMLGAAEGREGDGGPDTDGTRYDGDGHM